MNSNLSGEKLYAELEKDYYEFYQTTRMLQELKSYVRRLEMQNNYLKQENAEIRRKLEKITDTAVGKMGMRGYYFMQRIKRKICK